MHWIDKSGMDRLSVHLMGGEPTLHPLFFDMLNEALRRECNVMVFSNASTQISIRIVSWRL